jgi:hypothetical protein
MNCSEQFEDAEDDNSLPHCVKNPTEKIDDVALLISEANINESDDEYNDASESETDSEEDFIDGLEGGDITKKYITAVQHRQSNP